MRAHPRRKTRLSVRVLSIDCVPPRAIDLNGARFVAHDIGAGGLGLETLIELQLGDVLELEVILPGGKCVPASVVVRNLKTENRGAHLVYQAGVQYAKISEEGRKAIASYAGSGDFIV